MRAYMCPLITKQYFSNTFQTVYRYSTKFQRNEFFCGGSYKGKVRRYKACVQTPQVLFSPGNQSSNTVANVPWGKET